MTDVRLRLRAPSPGFFTVYLAGVGGSPIGGQNPAGKEVLAREVQSGTLDATGMVIVSLIPSAEITPAD